MDGLGVEGEVEGRVYRVKISPSSVIDKNVIEFPSDPPEGSVGSSGWAAIQADLAAVGVWESSKVNGLEHQVVVLDRMQAEAQVKSLADEVRTMKSGMAIDDTRKVALDELSVIGQSIDHVMASGAPEPLDPQPEPATDVDRVIDQLDRRIIGTPDRVRLRGALDKADAPLGGRAGQDQAIGRAIRVVGEAPGLRLP